MKKSDLGIPSLEEILQGVEKSITKLSSGIQGAREEKLLNKLKRCFILNDLTDNMYELLDNYEAQELEAEDADIDNIRSAIDTFSYILHKIERKIRVKLYGLQQRRGEKNPIIL